MMVYIQEWPNKTATIMTSSGQVVWTFSSIKEAHQACHDWHSIVYVGNAGCRDNVSEDATDGWCLA